MHGGLEGLHMDQVKRGGTRGTDGQTETGGETRVVGHLLVAANDPNSETNRRAERHVFTKMTGKGSAGTQTEVCVRQRPAL